MGGAVSKGSRKLPRRAETPSWAGARTPLKNDLKLDMKEPVSSESSRAGSTVHAQPDTKDNQFLSKLSELGPVRVEHHKQYVSEGDKIASMFQSRAKAEAAIASHDNVVVSSLSDLLEERKHVRTKKELEVLTESAGGHPVKSIGPDGEEVMTVKGVWNDPVMKSSS